MTRILIILLLFVSCMGNTTQTAKAEAIVYSIQTSEIKSDTLLCGIQSKIYEAFIQDIMSKENKAISKNSKAKDKQTLTKENKALAKNNKALSSLSRSLNELNKSKKQNLILYWQSYLQFYSSIYYLKKGDKETAEREIDKGINWLNEMKNKNSEDYALLAMLQGFGIQFKGMKAMFISEDIKENFKKAIAIDSNNLRAYYVSASNDFHTPKEYGGGKKTEKYLLKAISLPVQQIKNDYLPSWGKVEAYEMLIKFYIKNKKWDLAKKYFQKSIKLYPKSYTINQLARQLIE